MKIVGVVIPIHNVERYLKECLDSVINQTYTNLEIILVNDGSTDENSLSIAKEYALKDKRITLFDKKNGGQSSARNVGIGYFSGEYKLKNKTQTIKKNSLIEFNIEGNNPYEIYAVYKSYKAFSGEKDLINFTYPYIDYIIFLDSDDYWELNCIEECVPRMDGVEVVWFDYIDLRNNVLSKGFSRLRSFNFKEELIITALEWLKTPSASSSFSFAWQGLIDFCFLKDLKLKFIDKLYAEDMIFGILLFSQVKYIYVLPKIFYIYRRIQGSSMTLNKIPSYLSHYNFQSDNIDTSIQTYKYFSVFIQYLVLCDFINSCKNSQISLLVKQRYLPYFFKQSRIFFKAYAIDLENKWNIEAINRNIFDNINLNLFKYANKENLLMYKNVSSITTAKSRIHNHLSYKLGQAIIENSKSLLGYIRMPFILSYIKDKHKQEQEQYQEAIKKNPNLKLPNLESYPDYKESLKEKECFTYKLGEAFIKASKTWYKGGYVRLWFEVRKLKRDLSIEQ